MATSMNEILIKYNDIPVWTQRRWYWSWMYFNLCPREKDVRLYGYQYRYIVRWQPDCKGKSNER
jgi:hypothetical protein